MALLKLPFALIFMGLALVVFSWGLQYKLSLYDPPQASSHLMPQAKLLSQNEQATTTDNPLIAKTPVKLCCAALLGAFIFFFGVFDSLNSLALGQKEREMDRPWRLHSFASLNTFFFRPPPIPV
jgi:hypothetical protein